MEISYPGNAICLVISLDVADYWKPGCRPARGRLRTIIVRAGGWALIYRPARRPKAQAERRAVASEATANVTEYRREAAAEGMNRRR
jgi:hypothetical protein